MRLQSFCLKLFVPLLVCFFALSATGASAFAATVAQPEQQCMIVLDKLHPGEQVSRVLSQQCVAGNQQLVAPLASVLIMTWYKDVNFGGSSTQVIGAAGPCDSAGYGIASMGSGWNDVVSSFKVWNNCGYTRGFTNTNWGGSCWDWHGNASNVNPFNDQISSFWVASAFIHC